MRSGLLRITRRFQIANLSVTLQDVPEQKQFENNLQLKTAVEYVLGQEVTIPDTGTADTTFSVSHSLGRIPEHVQLLIGKADTTSAYVQIRRGATTWTRSMVYLQCNTANAAITIRIC
jgi:hypothetical protein